jgi:ATP-binding cassette, subfamily B, bacterial
MADHILVLDKGELIEMGTHKELLAKERWYTELFNLQAVRYQ